METPQIYFIVTLSRHRNLGLVLAPYFAEQVVGEPFLRLQKRARLPELNAYVYPFSADELRLVKLAERYSDENLVKKYCPGKSVKELELLLRKEEFKAKLVTYLENILTEMLDILRYREIPLYMKRERYSNLYEEDKIVLVHRNTDAIFNFDRREEEIRYHLSLRDGNEYLSLLHRNFDILVNEPCRILILNKLYFFDSISASKLIPFREKQYISIPTKLEEKYFETFIHNAVRSHEVICSGFAITEVKPVVKAVLSLETDLLGKPVFIPAFSYNDQLLRLKEGEKRAVSLKKLGKEFLFEIFSRESAFEKEVVDFLLTIGLAGDEAGMKLSDPRDGSTETDLYGAIEWLASKAELLASKGVGISLTGLPHAYYLGQHELKISVDNKIDWFDLEMMVLVGSYAIPFIRFKRLILGGIREYKLPNGEIFVLPEAWFSRFGGILSLGKIEANRISVQPFHFMLLENLGSKDDSALQERIQKVIGQKIQPVDVPETLRAQLRSYQKAGFNWLYHLWQNGLNGCLADDMGLGKTLQTLVLLLRLKKASNELLPEGPDERGQLSLFSQPKGAASMVQPSSLVVLPVSLLHNWENEIRKFAPELRVYTYSGVKRRDKIDLSRLIAHCYIILTTYGTVRNDCEVLSKYTFFYLILDESQHIKNADSKNFKTVSLLHAKHRLSITGTPIENSLSDLWSQMNFLNPGHLGSYNQFRDLFQIPIEKMRDSEASVRLNKLIAPFILRRTKEEVEADLPPVTEELLTIEMGQEQSEFYETEKSAVRNFLLDNIEAMEPRKTTFFVLQALTRLRQIAIHPRMLHPESDTESGKFNEIVAMLETLVAEKHKILVFSSFVKHLNLLEEECRKQQWGICRLTGQTRDRKSVIEEFQQDAEKNIFLISLKAGGVGLNLTAADYIFIIDPWWNPAAEMQAISRAHRIGQDKKVFVYRFISEKSIEEKIQLLQEKKNTLAREFIKSNDPFAVLDKLEIIQLFD